MAVTAADAVALRQDDLTLELVQLGLELGQLVVTLLDDRRHVRERAPVGGHLAQLFRALFDFELFPDFAPDRLLDFLEPVREQTFGQVIRESILVAELVQDGVFDVVALDGEERIRIN